MVGRSWVYSPCRYRGDCREVDRPEKIWVASFARWLLKWIANDLRDSRIQRWAAALGSVEPVNREAPCTSEQAHPVTALHECPVPWVTQTSTREAAGSCGVKRVERNLSVIPAGSAWLS